MKKKIFYIICAAVFILGFAITGFTEEMSSANFSITTSVISGGGSPTVSTNYQTDSTLGQSSPLMDPSDPPFYSNYNLDPGFWYTVKAEPLNECEGDFDDDGDVDGSDLAIFAADFGRTNCGSAPPCEGDFDGDNDVDGSDLAVFAADFGKTDCP